MKLNAVAAKKIAVVRMPPYTWRCISSQLCALTLALSLIARPWVVGERERVPILTPLAADLLITAVLYAATLSIVNTLILMAQVPLACLGSVLALVVTSTPFSVSAAVGFISIFAIAIMDGIILNFYIRQLWTAGQSVVDSIVIGADRHFRAVMMTALVDGLGLLPAALSTRVGAQTQRPLAIAVIGGAVSIALLTRVFQPTLMYVLHNYIGLTDNR